MKKAGMAEKLASHSPISFFHLLCIKLTVDAAYSAVATHSGARLCQTHKEDLKGEINDSCFTTSAVVLFYT